MQYTCFIVLCLIKLDKSIIGFSNLLHGMVPGRYVDEVQSVYNYWMIFSTYICPVFGDALLLLTLGFFMIVQLFVHFFF